MRAAFFFHNNNTWWCCCSARKFRKSTGSVLKLTGVGKYMPSNIMRMKLLGKAVRFDTLSYALIRFHICLHMLWYASIIWIVWSHQKVCHFKCERLWFYTLIYAFIRSKTLSYAMIHFLCAFIIFHTLSMCFYFASTLLPFALKCFHTLSCAFIGF